MSRSLGLLVLTCLGGAAVAFACGTDGSEFGGGPGGQNGGDGGKSGNGTFGGDGGDNGNGGTQKVASLVFDPPAQTITTDGTSKTASYKLKATQFDGSVIEVEAESLQFDRPDLASAANGKPIVLTAPGEFAGTGKLHGVYGGVEATADLTVNIAKKEFGPGVDTTLAAKLDAADLGADTAVTKIRYPYDKTVFPLGLTTPLVMWDAPHANDMYRVRFEETGYTYDIYAIVPSVGQLRIDQKAWDRVTASNGGDNLKITLSRLDVGTGTAFTSATESWTIAPSNLRGAIYYWTASKDSSNKQIGHIARIRPGQGAEPELMKTGWEGVDGGVDADHQCMGCHAVSADGTTLAAAVSTAPIEAPYSNGWFGGRGWASFDLPTGAVRKQTKMNGSNLALTPDGKYTVFGGRFQDSGGTFIPGSKYVSLADTETGTIKVDSGLDDIVLRSGTAGIAMPAFSPDGKTLAVVEHDNDDLRDNVLPNSFQILLLAFNRETLHFDSTPTRLPTADFSPFPVSGLGYPSFTPDSTKVAFHVGNHSTGCFDSCLDDVHHQGAIYIQSVDGAGTPVRLTALDDPPETVDRGLSVEPTFNPTERAGYSWVVFTSMRDWGNKLTGDPINGKRRLWVAAIDASGSAVDPSHPAFYLEGQEDLPNMRGFWTLAGCTDTPKPGDSGGTCSAGFECCSGFCSGGKCVDVSKIACVGIGGDCTQTSDCCNSGAVTCQTGKCQATTVN